MSSARATSSSASSRTSAGRDVFIVQGTDYPVNDNFVELLFWIDAFKRASATQVTAVIPYFSYAKGDKKDEPRVSIRARVCADCIEAAGADRVLTMDLHSPQIQGFFKIPVDHLYAMPVLVDYFRAKEIPDLVVAAPDVGFGKQAYKFGEMMHAPVVFGNKTRRGHDEKAEMLDIVGQVEGKNVLIVDDFTISGGTLIEMAVACKERGASDIYACVSHGVFSQGLGRQDRAEPDQGTGPHRHDRAPLRAAGALLQGRQHRQPVRRRHHLDPPPRERQPALQLLSRRPLTPASRTCSGCVPDRFAVVDFPLPLPSITCGMSVICCALIDPPERQAVMMTDRPRTLGELTVERISDRVGQG